MITHNTGAIIVDPVSSSIIAKSHTNDTHPLQHAVMKCIDLVSRQQDGGK